MNIDLRLIAFLLSLAAALFAAVLGVSVGTEEYLLPTAVLAIFGATVLVSRPHIAAFGAITTFSCGLTFPGLPGQMTLFDAFCLSLIGIYGLQIAMNWHRKVPLSNLERLLLLYCGWILFTGSYRGFGFMALGSSKIGGFNYLHLLLAASLVITLPRIGLTQGMWRPAFLLMGVLAPVTLIADLLVTQGFTFGIIRLFVQTSSEIGSMVQEANSGGADTLNRLWAAGPAATGMLISLLCLVPAHKFLKFTSAQWLVIYSGIFTLSLLSGFRLITASLLVITALVFFFQKEISIPRILFMGCVASVGLIGIYACSRMLPNSVQRAISWLPGISVNNAALGDATATVDWRLNVWKEGLHFIPDFWLVGKGFSYEMRDVQAALFDPQGIDWALTVGSYHNGWLSMILCTGVVGAVLGIILLIVPARHHWKRQFLPWRNAELKRYHGVFLAAQITIIATFFTIYGDVHVSFPLIFFQWAVLEHLVDSDASAPALSEGSFGATESDSLYQES